ncbi:hypothetical protein ACFX1S_040974 [Malus domestica]
MLSSDIRTAFVQALLDPDKYQSQFAEVNMKEALYAQYLTAVTFTNDDLMLKTTKHNRPNGEIYNHKVNRILLDPGLSVSLLPLRPEPTKAEVKAKMFPKTAERSKPASKLQSRPESSAIPSSKNDEGSE